MERITATPILSPTIMPENDLSDARPEYPGENTGLFKACNIIAGLIDEWALSPDEIRLLLAVQARVLEGVVV